MKKLICFIVVMSFIMVSKSDAVMLTEDVANLPHNILTGVNTMQSITEAVKQYKLLMDEYKMMAKNMAAPYFWVFNEVKNFDKNINKYKEQYKKYGDKAGSAEASPEHPDG